MIVTVHSIQVCWHKCCVRMLLGCIMDQTAPKPWKRPDATTVLGMPVAAIVYARAELGITAFMSDSKKQQKVLRRYK